MLDSHEYNRAEFFATVEQDAHELLARLHFEYEGDPWATIEDLKGQPYREYKRALELMLLLVNHGENETELEWDY